MVQRMFVAANIEGKYTNHSLRTTGASQLFAAKVPEAIIQKRTGHRSLDSLRLYETRSIDLQQTLLVSTILSGETTTFDANNMTPKIAERKLNMSNNSVGDLDKDDEQFIVN